MVLVRCSKKIIQLDFRWWCSIGWLKMSRYKNTVVKINKENGSRVYGLTLYPTIPIQDGDEFIYPFDGERVETILHKYYQDTSLWWIWVQTT